MPLRYARQMPRRRRAMRHVDARDAHTCAGCRYAAAAFTRLPLLRERAAATPRMKARRRRHAAPPSLPDAYGVFELPRAQPPMPRRHYAFLLPPRR